MTYTTQPFSQAFINKDKDLATSPKNLELLANLIDSLEKLEAEMENLEKAANKYYCNIDIHGKIEEGK